MLHDDAAFIQGGGVLINISALKCSVYFRAAFIQGQRLCEGGIYWNKYSNVSERALWPNKINIVFSGHKAQSNTCNISMQHLATLSDCVVRGLAENVQHLSTSKTAVTKIDHFRTWLNTIQHIATCYNKSPLGGQMCATCCAQ